jgi:hypothetical protein
VKRIGTLTLVILFWAPLIWAGSEEIEVRVEVYSRKLVDSGTISYGRSDGERTRVTTIPTSDWISSARIIKTDQSCIDIEMKGSDVPVGRYSGRADFGRHRIVILVADKSGKPKEHKADITAERECPAP